MKQITQQDRDRVSIAFLSLIVGGLAFLAVSLLSTVAHATSGVGGIVCRVADPTGTPLNIRTVPYGTIVAAFNNGDLVSVLDGMRDGRGDWWVFVGTPEGKPIGWVYRNFIYCGGEYPHYFNN